MQPSPKRGTLSVMLIVCLIGALFAHAVHAALEYENATNAASAPTDDNNNDNISEAHHFSRRLLQSLDFTKIVTETCDPYEDTCYDGSVCAKALNADADEKCCVPEFNFGCVSTNTYCCTQDSYSCVNNQCCPTQETCVSPLYECCGGRVCVSQDGSTFTCVASKLALQATGCFFDTDCVSAGVCQTISSTKTCCVALGASGCTANNDCCSKLNSIDAVCQSGKCCHSNGAVCDVNADCCSGICVQTGASTKVCSAAKLVAQTNCWRDTDCAGTLPCYESIAKCCYPPSASVCTADSQCCQIGGNTYVCLQSQCCLQTQTCTTTRDCCGGRVCVQQSSTSSNRLCVASLLALTSTACYVDADCASPGVCYTYNSVNTCCIQALDSGCTTNAQCCQVGGAQHVCLSSECCPSTQYCQTAADCCGGRVCVQQSDGSRLCQASLIPANSNSLTCYRTADCVSPLSCSSGKCCIALYSGIGCTADSDCCTPASSFICGYSSNNFKCCKKTGAACTANSECCNSVCTSSVCVTTAISAGGTGTCSVDSDCSGTATCSSTLRKCCFEVNSQACTAASQCCGFVSGQSYVSCTDYTSTGTDMCCRANAQACTADTDCCSLLCVTSGSGKVCAATELEIGSACAVSTECASPATCSSSTCCVTPNGNTCSSSSQCCLYDGDETAVCLASTEKCCLWTDMACSADTDCCSGTCTSSVCTSPGITVDSEDVCFADADCETNAVCNTSDDKCCFPVGAGSCSADSNCCGYTAVDSPVMCDGTDTCCAKDGQTCTADTDCCDDSVCLQDDSAGTLRCFSSKFDVNDECYRANDCDSDYPCDTTLEECCIAPGTGTCEWSSDCCQKDGSDSYYCDWDDDKCCKDEQACTDDDDCTCGDRVCIEVDGLHTLRCRQALIPVNDDDQLCFRSLDCEDFACDTTLRKCCLALGSTTCTDDSDCCGNDNGGTVAECVTATSTCCKRELECDDSDDCCGGRVCVQQNSGGDKLCVDALIANGADQTCYRNADCASGHCVQTDGGGTRECVAQAIADGSLCYRAQDCSSDYCIWTNDDGAGECSSSLISAGDTSTDCYRDGDCESPSECYDYLCCYDAGETCSAASECCGYSSNAGTNAVGCTSSKCCVLLEFSGCSQDADCCGYTVGGSMTCDDGWCCTKNGNSCTSDDECCSGACIQDSDTPTYVCQASRIPANDAQQCFTTDDCQSPLQCQADTTRCCIDFNDDTNECDTSSDCCGAYQDGSAVCRDDISDWYRCCIPENRFGCSTDDECCLGDDWETTLTCVPYYVGLEKTGSVCLESCLEDGDSCCFRTQQCCDGLFCFGNLGCLDCAPDGWPPVNGLSCCTGLTESADGFCEVT